VIAIFALILTVICVLSVFLQLFRIKNEFQRLDEDQVITDELAKKLSKRLYWLVIPIILVAILSIISIILPYINKNW
jgi:heme/copper-type cytochrome/quinol oxidase subunit 2